MARAGPSTLRWYRSLYWRIGIGLVAFLALMLAAQGALFVWTLDQTAGTMPARSPRRLAVLVASDLGTAISADPSLDLQRYVREQYAHVFQPFVVIMRDGRTVSNHDDIPAELREAIRIESTRGFGPPLGGRPPSPGAPSVPPDRAWETAPIFSSAGPVGRVAVLGGPPLERMARELGPTMIPIGIGVLAVGITLIAVFVFGPARRRLRAVQVATKRLGDGDLGARAPEEGGDEVASVARSFNRMADDLAARAKALDASDRARRQLLADVSHELMTPLTAIRGYVETLKMPGVEFGGEKRQRYLAIIDDETHRLERIIGDLLDLARLEGGGGTIRQEAVPVGALFDRVRARHEAESSARNIMIETSIEPPAEQVVGDPDRLEQALQNLTANALRHTPDGGRIRITAARVGGDVRLRVQDTGEGIPAEHLPLIFDRFYKIDSARRASGGSGLGLSIVKAIVERHGGHVVASNDRGAVFDLLLPATSL